MESPVYDGYWAKLANNASFPKRQEKVDKYTFRISTRKLPLALIKRYPHCVALESKALGIVIVPDISLHGMHQISFKETASLVLKANMEIDSLHLYVRQLWIAIICKVYYFEDPANQQRKLEEVCCCCRTSTHSMPRADFW